MMFLDKDSKQVTKELDCYAYCMTEAIKAMATGNYKKAAEHHEVITRSLNELQRLKDNKQFQTMIDKVWGEGKEKVQNDRLLAILKSGTFV